VSAIPQPDVFAKAHQDAQRAVATFLPSLTPKPPAPAPPPQPKRSPVIIEAMRVASVARHVEGMSARVARGLPPEQPPPPSPQETFPPEIDQVHIRAISAAIAAHPETERGPLLHEAHANIVKWIAAHNGQIVHDGHVQIATSAQSAESLAAKIVNEAVDAHDQRKIDQQGPQSNAGGSDKSGISDTGPAAKGGRSSVPARSSSASDAGGVDQGSTQAVSGPLAVGSTDTTSGRIVTQPTDNLDEAQDIATQAAPALKENLQAVENSVPGATVDGVREEKDTSRAKEKVEDDKPVNTLTDLVAGRIAVDSPEAKDAAVNAIKKQSPVIDEEDNFQQGDPDYGFRSHTIQSVMPTGASAEVQVVPKEIAEADDDTHKTYEEGRSAEASGDDEAAQKAMAENKAVHDAAMEKFNARNQDKSGAMREALKAGGYQMIGKPIKIGGKTFIAVNEEADD
jgi:hypothetical protein